ncbi:hypothetical protein SAMN05444392_101508 [Seinonella peptonophila]|uniref:Uncharacterized protein n=1 Tax=Seinonella peptonophila TaxID=112248 RepID=A0A1M4TKC5_9BACL|nr:hypothetical protein [Seinonella peptonophila]SHE44939.1 hypothetical protein SAMN05444392_101508 [Seinonella peptonophila]
MATALLEKIDDQTLAQDGVPKETYGKVKDTANSLMSSLAEQKNNPAYFRSRDIAQQESFQSKAGFINSLPTKYVAGLTVLQSIVKLPFRMLNSNLLGTLDLTGNTPASHDRGGSDLQQILNYYWSRYHKKIEKEAKNNEPDSEMLDEFIDSLKDQWLTPEQKKEQRESPEGANDRNRSILTGDLSYIYEPTKPHELLTADQLLARAFKGREDFVRQTEQQMGKGQPNSQTHEELLLDEGRLEQARVGEKGLQQFETADQILARAFNGKEDQLRDANTQMLIGDLLEGTQLGKVNSNSNEQLLVTPGERNRADEKDRAMHLEMNRERFRERGGRER